MLQTRVTVPSTELSSVINHQNTEFYTKFPVLTNHCSRGFTLVPPAGLQAKLIQSGCRATQNPVGLFPCRLLGAAYGSPQDGRGLLLNGADGQATQDTFVDLPQLLHSLHNLPSVGITEITVNITLCATHSAISYCGCCWLCYKSENLKRNPKASLAKLWMPFLESLY